MTQSLLEQCAPASATEIERPMPPGAGLLLAGIGSVVVYALIAGIAVIV